MPEFIPKADDALCAWLKNFTQKLTVSAKLFGISDTELKEYKIQCDDLIEIIEGVSLSKTELKQKIELKYELKNEVITNIRNLVDEIKGNDLYNKDIGKQLGIVDATVKVDSNNAKPILNAKIVNGEILISYNYSIAKGIAIYSKRNTESNFSFLAMETGNPYYDHRFKLVVEEPETRYYYAYFINDKVEQFGLPSDVVSILL